MDDVTDVGKLADFLKTEDEDKSTGHSNLFDLIDEEDDDEDASDEENEYQYEFEEPDLLDLVAADVEEGFENEFSDKDDTEITYHKTVPLSTQDQEVIDQCKNSYLRLFMIANRIKHLKLQALREKLFYLLSTCKEEIRNQEVKLRIPSTPTSIKLKYFRLGHPYFKDEHGYASPTNTDVARKERNKELIGYNLYTEYHKAPWKQPDKDTLSNAIQKQFVTHVVMKKQLMIDELKSSLKQLENKDKKSVKMNIANLEYDICKIKFNTTTYPIPDEFTVDWEAASKEVTLHTSMECAAFWNIFLKPTINKKSWTRAENKQMVELCRQFKFQNWDAIAEKLGTQRSGYIMCVHFHTKLCIKYAKFRKFTPEEDSILLNAVQMHRIGNFIPWSMMPYYFNNRSKATLYVRYNRYLVSDDTKRGRFTAAEDVLLLLIHKRSNGNWKEILSRFPNRTLMQLKSRHRSCLRPSLKNCEGRWTVQEDEAILAHVQIYGAKQWNLAHKLIESGRDTASLRHRHNVIKKWMAEHPGSDVELVPRRQNVVYRRGVREKAYITELVLERIERDFGDDETPSVELLDTIMEEAMRTRQVARDFENTKLDAEDQALLQYFQLDLVKKPNMKLNATFVAESAAWVQHVLQMLAAHLDLPSKEEIEAIESLDLCDKQILCHLKDEQADYSVEPFSYLVAPNVITMQTFRNLMLNVDWFQLNGDQDSDIEDDLFYRRFKCVFKWPSILASNDLPKKAIEEVKQQDDLKALPKRGRPLNKKRLWKVERMNRKRTMGRASSAADSSKEAPVDAIQDIQVVTEAESALGDVEVNEEAVPEVVVINDGAAQRNPSVRTYKRKVKSKQEAVKLELEGDDFKRKIQTTFKTLPNISDLSQPGCSKDTEWTERKTRSPHKRYKHS